MAEKTYEVIPSPPPPMKWEEYKVILEQQWLSLLQSDAAQEEKDIQIFLQENPCLVPGAFGLTFSSGHFPFPCALISQPVLQGLGTKVPDFMWIAADSGTIYPILVEIEAPQKRWFTKEGVPHSEFTQAHTQLASWKSWFDSPTNRQLFLDYYLIPADLRDSRRLHPLYVLIYGRRHEFSDRPSLNAMRGNLARADETLMTFDRLSPEEKAQNMMCAVLIEGPSGRKYRALTVPPTVTLGSLEASYRAKITDKEAAVAKNILIAAERRDFLISRIPYWDSWVGSRSGMYQVNLGDCE